jgi:phosphohistidine swiveling domain-containing protein
VQQIDAARPAPIGAVLAGLQPDSGWAVVLPAAAALIAAQGSLLDPAMAAARTLGIPAVVEMGAGLAALHAGRQVVVDGDRGSVA